MAGAWQGVQVGGLKNDPTFVAWQADPAVSPPGGEEWAAFTGRIHAAVADLTPREGHVLAVAHDGVLQALEHAFNLKVRPCPSMTAGISITIQEGRPVASPFGEDEETVSCRACRIVSEGNPEGARVVWRGAHTFVNRYLPEEQGDHERPGWYIVTPNRHVRRWWQLRRDELQEAAEAARICDAVLSVEASADRSMIASLGWGVRDHLHLHCLPVRAESITEGYLNFDGRYRGDGMPEDLDERLAEALEEAIGTSVQPSGRASRDE